MKLGNIDRLCGIGIRISSYRPAAWMLDLPITELLPGNNVSSVHDNSKKIASMLLERRAILRFEVGLQGSRKYDQQSPDGYTSEDDSHRSKAHIYTSRRR